MKKLISGIIVLVLLSSCAPGRTTNNIKVTNISDKNLSCEELLIEIDFITLKVIELTEEESSKDKKNTGLQIAGAIFLVPLLFMDLTESERIEINAYRARYFHLTKLAENKLCKV
jgi:hypothetical protein|tara:strand:- start:97 stop:441 length:345 start_codon:yes stop_codon:yes gene_type:complete